MLVKGNNVMKLMLMANLVIAMMLVGNADEIPARGVPSGCDGNVRNNQNWWNLNEIN